MTTSSIEFSSNQDRSSAIQLSFLDHQHQDQPEPSHPHSNGQVPRDHPTSNGAVGKPEARERSVSTSSSKESFASCDDEPQPTSQPREEGIDDQMMRITLEQSKRDHEEHIRLQREEEEMLQKVLQLSLTDK